MTCGSIFWIVTAGGRHSLVARRGVELHAPAARGSWSPPAGERGARRTADWASAQPDEQAGIPERIGERLLALGRAYGLHYLSTLHGAEQNRWNADQAAALADEVRFVLRVAADQALREHLQPMLVFAEPCGHSKTTDLILEAP